jgi:hypothetical protein
METLNTSFEYTMTALTIHVVCGVAGQGCRNGNTLLRQKFSKIAVAWFIQDREIAAVDHHHPSRPRLGYQLPKTRV